MIRSAKTSKGSQKGKGRYLLVALDADEAHNLGSASAVVAFAVERALVQGSVELPVGHVGMAILAAAAETADVPAVDLA